MGTVECGEGWGEEDQEFTVAEERWRRGQPVPPPQHLTKDDGRPAWDTRMSPHTHRSHLRSPWVSFEEQDGKLAVHPCQVHHTGVYQAKTRKPATSDRDAGLLRKAFDLSGS